jgi:hypothetical protein
MSFDPAPILLFVYRRPVHTRKTLQALAKNKGAAASELVIYSDGARGEADAKGVAEVRGLCAAVKGFAKTTLIPREENVGLAANILQGVGEQVARHGRVIVMEDDLRPHPSFLTFMNGALSAYETHPRILSVSGYLPPRWKVPRPKNFGADVWLNPRNMSWGWGTWQEKWQSVDWEQAQKDNFAARQDLQGGFAHGGADLPKMLMDQLAGKLDSWSVRFSYAHYRSERFSLLPAESYIKPIGFDGSGMHCRPNPLRWIESTRQACKSPVFPEHPEVDQDFNRALRKSFDRHHRLAERLGI